MAGYEPPVTAQPSTTARWPAYGGYYWQGPPPPPPPRRSGGAGIAIVVVVVMAFLCAGVAVAFGAWRLSAGTDDTSAVSRGIAPAATAPATTPGQPAPSSGAGADASGIATAVDPTIVDVNTTLGLQQAAAAGTGIVLTSTGEILTNNHVINGATSISVTDIGNGQTYTAAVVGYDRTHDIAVIQLQNASGLQTAPIGDSSAVHVGDAVVALGNAGGRGGTPAVAPGSVTGLNETITASDENGGDTQQLNGLIRVAADIQPGDSGGPLVDGNGHIIGIDTAATQSYRFQAGGGEGFAIPINAAMTLARQIESGQATDTVHIGATAFLGVAIDSGSGGGAVITQVVPNSPAAQAGLVQGDRIVSIDGTAVNSPNDLTGALARHHPGDKVSVKVAGQSGRNRSVPVTLAEGPAA